MSGEETIATALLSLRDLEVRAGGKALLRGVNLDLGPDELVAVTGPSGCGKTTLLQTVCGLRLGAGTVSLQGRVPNGQEWPDFRRRVVLVAQQPVLVPGTVGQNLSLPFSYHNARASFEPRRARRLLARLGLDAIGLEAEAATLSVGQQQRLCLARALLLEPVVLLLDEPTSALDEAAVVWVEDAVREHTREHGAAALIVTHSSRQAARWCQRRLDLSEYLAATPAGAAGAAGADARRSALPVPQTEEQS